MSYLDRPRLVFSGLALAGALVILAAALAGAGSPAHAGVNGWTPLGPDGGAIGALAVSPGPWQVTP